MNNSQQIKNSERLSAIPSWPAAVSYFNAGSKKDASPVYEVSFVMYANGVSRKLKLNYISFSLNGELSSLEFLAAEPCP